ncbi:hypothetical protein EXIGLDRAFT_698751 [Exidia glandulosa HHB12029]|uniref:Ubiquitin-like protease family profile domain-containing protein n=1 Tax=Exidia glandulosa HHB12029 TaxID=1314781 RepID=A0A165E432_EXIGL|nr:hypothetical protein EXIGLDRAFT_698751 [Exidia glandulosa HHB12029]
MAPSSPRAVFVASEWINCGKRFPSPAPYHLLLALRTLLKIPEVATFDIPHSTESVSAITAQNLPILDGTKSAHPVFLPTAPEVDELSYEGLKVPSLGIITELSHSVKQAWLDGKQSFVLQHISPQRLPLWIINFWFQVHSPTHTAAAWRRAFDWCRSYDPAVHAALEAALYSVRWKPDLLYAVNRGGVSTRNLACLVGTNWVDDSTMGAMLSAVQKTLQTEQPYSPTQILTIEFPRNLLSSNTAFFNTYSEKRAPLEYNIGDKLASGHWKSVFYVRNVNGNHWIAICINIPLQQILYADSLGGKFPEEHRIGINMWLAKHGLGPCSLGTMPHAIQDDSYSCGIIAINSIEHNVLHVPLWTEAQKHTIRVDWLHRIIDLHKERLFEVRYSYS